MACCLILTKAVLSSVCVYGGGSRKGQIQVVQKGVEIVIGDDILNTNYNALYYINYFTQLIRFFYFHTLVIQTRWLLKSIPTVHVATENIIKILHVPVHVVDWQKSCSWSIDAPQLTVRIIPYESLRSEQSTLYLDIVMFH